MQQPEVTVVITTRNRPSLVVGAIDSALDQTMRAIEVVVVDDASTQPVRLARTDERLRLLRVERPRGVCAARNAGLATARGRWITFLDDDDRLLPDMLAVSLEAACTSPLPLPVAALSAIQEVDEEDRPIRVLRPATLARRFGASTPTAPPAHATLVVPTEVVREIGGWDERLRAWEHTDFFLRLRPTCSVQGVERITYLRRVHHRRLSENLPARVDGMWRTLAKHEAAFTSHPRSRARYLGAIGISWLRMGRWDLAVAATTAGLRAAPTRPKGVAQWLASLAGPRAWAMLATVHRAFHRRSA